MPAVSQIHIDQALTNISVMYRNESYVGDQVLPTVPAAKRSDKYFLYKKEDFLSPSGASGSGALNSLRRPGSEAAEIDYSVSTATYFAEAHAYRGLVTDAESSIADNPMQPDIDQTVQLTERLMLDNEISVAGIAFKRANFPSSNKVALSGGGTGTSSAQYASAES